jgi:hypothetical protein
MILYSRYILIRRKMIPDSNDIIPKLYISVKSPNGMGLLKCPDKEFMKHNAGHYVINFDQ